MKGIILTNKKDWKAYWKFMFAKAFRTGLQSAISLWLASSANIINAETIEVVGVAFLSSFVTVIQHALEQYKPKETF
jgi:hypothetical protein